MALDIVGEYLVPASRETVYSAVNDAEILKLCIPGCEEIEARADGEYAATVRFAFGPLEARFKGKVRLFDRDPPKGYRLVGEGEGGVAGFAKSAATVTLVDTPDGTKLTYQLEANVGGKIAQLGQRLLLSTTKKMADQFFENLVAALAEQRVPEVGLRLEPEPEPEPKPEHEAPLLPQLPSFGLHGKRALVTGAGRGIGLAAASTLAAAGAHVVLAARTQAEIEAAAGVIRERGHRADTLSLDVSDVDAVRKAMSEAEAFDILVNNAGTNRPAHVLDVDPADFDAVLNLNVRAAFFVAQAFAKKLVELGRPGTVINMSSQMGHVGAARRTVYCASKHAVEGMTKAMAVELAPHGIRVNSLAATFIETPMTRGFLQNEDFKSEVLQKIKLGRLGQVTDLTGGILFLASDASSLMTGSSLVIDGGWTAD
jgi:NAD(P)-dependent dehydrogenase (short-subunit alcohol dehydrogenase family)/carbon monoxide dehydrogenase subunit G